MAGGSSHQARQALSAIRRLATLTWRLESSSSCSSSSSFAANPAGLRGYAGYTSKYEDARDARDDEFWAVEGEILRVKGGIEKNRLRMAVRSPPRENQNLSRKQVGNARHQRVMAARISKSERGQEDYWKSYLKRFQSVRQQWEKLYYDEVPEVVKPATVPVDKNDPFTILGLKRRDKTYSPVELKSAYREMALKYHPDHNPGQAQSATYTAGIVLNQMRKPGLRKFGMLIRCFNTNEVGVEFEAVLSGRDLGSILDCHARGSHVNYAPVAIP